jgi:DNA-binding XRE family transcriptional regulator
MTQVQVIEQGGKPAFYVIPASLWERVRGELEDLEDEAAYDQAIAADDGIRYPAPVAHAIADGVHAVRAWREHRGMTQEALALAADVSKPFISQIESGKREGSMGTLKKLASALGVAIDALT